MSEFAPAVAVIGSGAWGTTIATLIGRREPVALVCRSAETARVISETRRHERRLPGVDLPRDLLATADPSVVGGAELVVLAVPSAYLRGIVGPLGGLIPPTADVLSLVKGIERGSLMRMSEVIADAAGIDIGRIAALSGPNLAQEIARRRPASAVVAAAELDLARRVSGRLMRRTFRLYVNPDIVGVELCGATKNIVAIAAGAADEIGFGDNGKAALMTRGLAEMMRLGIAVGANPLTYAGLAGIGDIIATCGSPLSRNHRLGEELARGRSWAEVEATLPGVAEGAYTVTAALELAGRHGVEMPIAREVHAALFEGKSVMRCLIDLVSREQKDELADFRVWLAGRAGGRAG